MKHTEMPYEIMLISSKDLIVPKAYQRRLRPSRVSRIVSEFDEHIANEPKVSFRNGCYYVFDGQHTIAARVKMNGGRDILIRCKVYRGLTESDEALLFAQQTGESAPLTASAEMRALIFAGDPMQLHSFAPQKLRASTLALSKDAVASGIICINTAFSEFKRVGAELYKEALAILMPARGGAPESLRAETLLGVLAFVELYHGDYNRTRLVNKLRNVDPISIYRSGRSDVNLPGTKKYLNQVYRIYNGASRKGTLPINFDAVT